MDGEDLGEDLVLVLDMVDLMVLELDGEDMELELDGEDMVDMELELD